MVRISVLYPNQPGREFDFNYYIQWHLTMVEARLKSFGLIRTEVDKGLAGGAPGTPAPYVCIGYVWFNSVESFRKGMRAHGEEIMDDIRNYTDIVPQIQISEIVS
jgi:uncharacterized protein (TIGR02118 family)